ncbi:MAG: hydrogenase/urease maturation nickel metallochaperone HypA [bacterium]
MHEFSLAKAAKQTIIDNYKEHRKIIILIGEIQQIDKILFKQALEKEIKELSIEIEYQEIPAKFRCNVCQHEFLYDDLDLTEEEKENIHFIPETIYIFVKCPKCGSNDFNIIQGRGVYIQLPS